MSKKELLEYIKNMAEDLLEKGEALDRAHKIIKSLLPKKIYAIYENNEEDPIYLARIGSNSYSAFDDDTLFMKLLAAENEHNLTNNAHNPECDAAFVFEELGRNMIFKMIPPQDLPLYVNMKYHYQPYKDLVASLKP